MLLPFCLVIGTTLLLFMKRYFFSLAVNFSSCWYESSYIEMGKQEGIREGFCRSRLWLVSFSLLFISCI